MTDSFEHKVLREIADLRIPLGRIEQKQDDFRLELLGDGGRIPKLEKAQEWNDKKQWIHSAVVVPVISLIVGAAKKLGIV